MKKIIITFALAVFFMGTVFGFAGCDKNNKGSNNNPESPNNEVLTYQQILKNVADDFDEKAGVGSGCFSSKTGEIYNYIQYDENVELGINLIREVSKISNLEDSKWYNSATFNVQDGKADKILGLKLSMSTNDDIVNLNLIIKFSIKGLNVQTKTKSFNLYNFLMTYNKETEDVSIDAVYEKSRDIENVEYGDYSVSNCFKFSYNGKVIVATSFKRNIDIDDVQNPALINNSTISEYNFLRFDLSSNTVLTEITDFDEEGSLKNSIVNSIKETFVTLNNVNLLTNGVNAQEIDISVTLLNASSAENISQLV